MLGRGRPFVIELIKAQKGDINEEHLSKIQGTINSKYSIISKKINWHIDSIIKQK